MAATSFGEIWRPKIVRFRYSSSAEPSPPVWSRQARTRGNGAWWTIGMSGPKPARCLIFELVSESEPIVRPWKPPSKAMIPGRWVW